MSMYIGEALAGDGNEIAHIDLLIGDKTGPVGVAFANALARQSEGHSNLLAVLTPNLAVKPATVLITKVTIKGMKQAVQMFGPAQAAVAKAVADSVAGGVIPDNCCPRRDEAEQFHQHRMFGVDGKIALFVGPYRKYFIGFVFRKPGGIEFVRPHKEGQRHDENEEGNFFAFEV